MVSHNDDTRQMLKLFQHENNYIEIRALKRKQNGSMESHGSFYVNGNIDEGLEWADKKIEDKAEIFFSPNPRLKKGGTKDSVETMTKLYVDLDLEGEGIEDAKCKLLESSFAPSMIVLSGYGLHGYWFIEPIKDKELWRKTNKALQKKFEHLKADPSIATDESRIMRLVPYPNLKNGSVKPTRIMHLTNKKYKLEELAKAFSINKVNTIEKEQKSKNNNTIQKKNNTNSNKIISPNISTDEDAFNDVNINTEDLLKNSICYAKEGNRHNTGIELCQKLKEAGLSFETAESVLKKFQKAVNGPDYSNEYSWDETERTLRWVYQNDLNIYRSTDVGRADLFITLFNKDVRYCVGKWFLWNGRYWQHDETGRRYEYAKDVANNLRKKGEKETIDENKERFNKYANKCESKRALDAILALASKDPRIAVTPDQLDSHPFLFNVKNGTLNLRTGKLQELQRGHLMTMGSEVEFDPDAKCPLWLKFLNEVILNENKKTDPETIKFLQKAAGYSMSGSIKEEILFFLFGFGGNGKGTFIETIRMVLGDYAKEIGFSNLLTNRKGNPDDRSLPRLKGARFLSASEPEDGQSFSVGKLKSITGGDKLVARWLYMEEFEYSPEFKLWLSGNRKPTPGSDDGFWRRMNLIEFRRKFIGTDRDSELKGKEGKLAKELSGVLNWMINGCLLWQTEKLIPSANVRKSTLDYRADSDVIGLFLSQYYEDAPIDERVPLKDISQKFKEWAEKNGECPLGSRKLGKNLSERGYRKEISGETHIYGLKLKEKKGN